MNIKRAFIGLLIGLVVAFIVDLLFIRPTMYVLPSLLAYIICALTGWSIGINSRKKHKTKKSKTIQKKKEQRIVDFGDNLAFVLENTLKFVDAYLACCPGEWLHLFISNILEKDEEFSTNLTSYYNEYIEITIIVGSWYDGFTLYGHEDEQDYMEGVYTFDAKENTFTYKMLIGTSTNCIISRDLLKDKLFDSLVVFEKEHPDRKLTRTDFGVHHSWNLDK